MSTLDSRGCQAGLLALSLWLNPATALEFDEGRAYDREDGRLLYSEHHYLWDEAGARQRLVLYRCPDGSPFARKRVSYRDSAIAPDFDFEDGRNGYREGVRTAGSGREVYFREDRDATLETQPLPADADAVIDAGFDEMVRGQWDALGAGGRVSRPFLIPSRFDYIAVRVDGDADAERDDGPVRRLQMRLDLWFGFLVAPIELTYSRPERRLLEFAGVGTIRDADGDHQDVRIVFPRVPPARPVKDDLATARSVPLVQGCDAA